MGPIALFDKSFLEGLNPDEAVWFDHFFLANVCPMFYAETQSDLAKDGSSRGSPEELVGRLANKFPEFSGSPNLHHLTICHANLLGESVPLSGRIIVPAGCQAKINGHYFELLPESIEAKAFLRWTQGDFQEEERKAAAEWRLSSLGFPTDGIISFLQQETSFDDRKCSTLADVYAWTNALADSLSPEQQLSLGCGVLGLSSEDRGEEVVERFDRTGRPPLKTFAPYVDFCFRVELFYHLAANKSQLKKNHRIDICYLFYLPFCQLFVSNDWVHKKCAPLFLRSDQQFVVGDQLKSALKQLDDTFKILPETEKQKSIHQLAPHPPTSGDNLITGLWDMHWPKWRERRPSDSGSLAPAQSMTQWQEKLRQLEAIAKARAGEEVRRPSSSLDAVVRRRVARKRKGSWWLVPEELRATEVPDDEQHLNLHGGLTQGAVVDREVSVFITNDSENLHEMPGCRTFVEAGKLHIDCAPPLKRRYTAVVPDGAIISRAVDDGEIAVFVPENSELALLIQQLWMKEERRGGIGER